MANQIYKHPSTGEDIIRVISSPTCDGCILKDQNKETYAQKYKACNERPDTMRCNKKVFGKLTFFQFKKAFES